MKLPSKIDQGFQLGSFLLALPGAAVFLAVGLRRMDVWMVTMAIIWVVCWIMSLWWLYLYGYWPFGQRKETHDG